MAPPEDLSVTDCVISLAATECCMPKAGWGTALPLDCCGFEGMGSQCESEIERAVACS